MKVLVPVDGSRFSDLAVESTARAKWINPSRIMLLNVVQPVETFMPFQIDSDNITKEQEIIASRSEWLKKPAQYLADNFPDCPSVEYRVKFGNPKQVIINTIAREKFDLVVMGSHGRSGVERLILGSCSQTILELASSAVLIAKYPLDSTDSPVSDFKRVLIPYDGSIYSRDVINWLSQRSFPPGTKFHIAMAIADFERVEKLDLTDDQVKAVKEQWNIIKQRAFEILEDVALLIGENVGNENVSIDAIAGDPREIIYSQMETFNADLVVLGSHGRTGLDKIMLGSISLHVAQHTKIPVLIVRRMTRSDIPYDDEIMDDSPPPETEMRSGREDRPPFTMF